LLFEGGDSEQGAQLVQDPTKPNCYSIKGEAIVSEAIINDLTVYLAISTDADTSVPPESCHDADPETGCGGLGSWYY
uniref:Cadherin_4 domain-containing protein n=1 Tax=Anisakis simplex TaxID=6269 RepID=A0A0M3J5X5_ANISI